MSAVVYACPFIPPDWIVAHGLRPFRMIPSGHAPGLEAIEGLCPFARAFASSAWRVPDAAAVVVTTACDQMRRVAEWLGAAGGGATRRPVHLFHVPATWQTPAAAGLYRSELLRLGRFLESCGGTRPSVDRLARTMVLCQVSRSRVGMKPVLGSPGGTGLFAEHPSSRVVNEAVSASCREHPRQDSCANRHPERPGIALVGGPVLLEDFELFALIEQLGGEVVLDGTETGERTLPARYDPRRLETEPISELVAAFFGSIPDPLRRPDMLFHPWLARKMESRGARGVILYRHTWCDRWHAQVGRLRQTLRFPVLDLESGGADPGGRARTMSRLQAFMELLS